MASASSSNVVGVHYRVGKKIGEGSFGVIFEGHNLLNNNAVAIKFVSQSGKPHHGLFIADSKSSRNLGKLKLPNYEMNIVHTRCLLGAVSYTPLHIKVRSLDVDLRRPSRQQMTLHSILENRLTFI